MIMAFRFDRNNNLIAYLRLLWVTTFVLTILCFPSSGSAFNLSFDSKIIITPRNIDLEDGVQMFEIGIHNLICLDEATSNYIHLEVNIKSSLKATDVSGEPSYNYEMLGFVGLSVSVLYIGIMLAKIRLEVRTIGNRRIGLCDSCHQADYIVRLVSCRPYTHVLCHSCLERLRYCPECNTLIRAFI